jgi:hypothetical protein
MGLLNYFLKKGIKVNVRVLVRSYLEVKDERPDSDEQELFAHILESRHSYERDLSNPQVFNYKGLSVDASRFESIEDLIAWVVSAEKRDLKLSQERLIKFESILRDAIRDELEAVGHVTNQAVNGS